MRYLNTVYIRDHRARVRHRRGSLLVSSPEGSQRVPLEAIDAIVVLGSAQITTQALDACVRRGVRVAALQMSGAVRFVVGDSIGGNVHLRTALYRAVTDDARSLGLSRAIVAAKLQNSRKVIDRWARDENDPTEAQCLAERAAWILDRVPRLAAASTANHVRGIEGDVARIYFGALARVVSKSRSRVLDEDAAPAPRPGQRHARVLLRPARDGVHRRDRERRLGLPDGLFPPRPRSGRPSLALDLAEELRALTDRFVVSLVRRRQVGPDSFVRTPGGGVYLSDEGRTRLLEAWEDHKEAEVQPCGFR